MISLTGCKTNVLTNDGRTAKIKKDCYMEYDFSKMSKEKKIGAFFTSFEIEYEYAGLPMVVTSDVMFNTVTGEMFLNDFC